MQFWRNGKKVELTSGNIGSLTVPYDYFYKTNYSLVRITHQARNFRFDGLSQIPLILAIFENLRRN